MPRKTRPHPPDKSRLVKASLRRLRAAAFQGTFDAWCATHHLPTPTYEYRFDEVRRWRFDIAFVPQKVAIEVHGGLFTFGHHSRGKGFLDDREKISAAILGGWNVLEVAPSGKHPQTLYSPAMLAWCQAMLT